MPVFARMPDKNVRRLSAPEFGWTEIG